MFQGRNVDRVPNRARVDTVLIPGVDEGHSGVRQALADCGDTQFWQHRLWTENRRPFQVLSFHATEIGGSIWLSVQELVDDTLLIAGRKMVAPPGEAAFVADCGGGHGAQGLAAGASGTVRGEELHVVGHRGSSFSLKLS